MFVAHYQVLGFDIRIAGPAYLRRVAEISALVDDEKYEDAIKLIAKTRRESWRARNFGYDLQRYETMSEIMNE